MGTFGKTTCLDCGFTFPSWVGSGFKGTLARCHDCDSKTLICYQDQGRVNEFKCTECGGALAFELLPKCPECGCRNTSVDDHNGLWD